MKTLLIVITAGAFASTSLPQSLLDPAAEAIRIQPRPAHMVNRGLLRFADALVDTLQVTAVAREETQAANFLKRLVERGFPGRIELRIGPDRRRPPGRVYVRLSLTKSTDRAVDGQSSSLRWTGDGTGVTISSPGVLGLLYGVVSLRGCIRMTDSGLVFARYDIDDRPVYRRRIIPAVFNVDNVEEILQFALEHKIETVAIASRQFPWYRVEPRYAAILQKIQEWKERFGGPRIMQMHNIYEGKQIEISNPVDVAALKAVIETSVRHGVDELMILADDLAPFVFGQGYVLTSERDRARFANMAEAHVFLMREIQQWLDSLALTTDLYYVPPYYTYEDMNCGDMALFKGTPWEGDAFRPLLRDLAYIGRHMPQEVFIVWSGPNVRSRSISIEDIEDWTQNLAGRVPFLWDNTIYSHHPFTTTPLFTAYENALPPDFHRRTAGEGMYLNGDLAAEDMKVAAITANDFWWNPASYDPAVSLRTAMENLYGAESVPLLLAFGETELALRKKIGERCLWFAADTLWKAIRTVREITDKNPFAYHLNYSRLKALRMQLKASVPEPSPLPQFLEECQVLDSKRRELLDAVARHEPGVSARFRTLLVPVPGGEVR